MTSYRALHRHFAEDQVIVVSPVIMCFLNDTPHSPADAGARVHV